MQIDKITVFNLKLHHFLNINKPGINKMKDDYWMTETDYPITIIASIFQPFVGA